MLWMQTYLFYCSVRLGVIVVAFLTLLQLLIPALYLLVYHIDILEPVVNLFRNDEYYKKNVLITKFLNWIDEYPSNLIIILNIYFVYHMATCILAIYAAFKLYKYLLLPFIVVEFMRVVVCLTGHIISMIVLKKLINLGVLVAFTLLGGFFILYLAYNWCTCVGLYQIIILIRSQRYRALYGDDPFSPNLTSSSNFLDNHDTIENVHVLTTPNGNEIVKLKQNNYEIIKAQENPKQKLGIISVLPANYENAHSPVLIGDSTRFKQRSRKWWQDTKSNEMAALNSQNIRNDSDVNYKNWQWSEIMMPAAKKRNLQLGANYRYS